MGRRRRRQLALNLTTRSGSYMARRLDRVRAAVSFLVTPRRIRRHPRLAAMPGLQRPSPRAIGGRTIPTTPTRRATRWNEPASRGSWRTYRRPAQYVGRVVDRCSDYPPATGNYAVIGRLNRTVCCYSPSVDTSDRPSAFTDKEADRRHVPTRRAADTRGPRPRRARGDGTSIG